MKSHPSATRKLDLAPLFAREYIVMRAGREVVAPLHELSAAELKIIESRYKAAHPSRTKPDDSPSET